MSSWTVLSIRTKEASEYRYGEYDSSDRWKAKCDLLAMLEGDDSVVKMATANDHVYVYFRRDGYAFGAARNFLEKYGDYVADAVVLGANNTSDMGTAKYYDGKRYVDEYEEGEHGAVGRKALAYMFMEHGIDARDPFHGQARDDYLRELEYGQKRGHADASTPQGGASE